MIAEKTSSKSVIVSWIVFIIVLVGVTMLIGMFKGLGPLNVLQRVLVYGLKLELKALLAWVGIYAFFTSAILWCRRHQVSNWALKVGVCGYGVYVFHQFILVYIYDYTQYPQMFGTYWLPWVSFIVATCLSLILTLLIRQTKIGRQFL